MVYSMSTIVVLGQPRICYLYVAAAVLQTNDNDPSFVSPSLSRRVPSDYRSTPALAKATMRNPEPPENEFLGGRRLSILDQSSARRIPHCASCLLSSKAVTLSPSQLPALRPRTHHQNDPGFDM